MGKGRVHRGLRFSGFGTVVTAFLFVFLFVIGMGLPVGAEEYTFGGSFDAWDGLMDALPSEVRSEFDGVSPDFANGSELADSATALGEKLGAAYWIDRLLEAFTHAFLPSLGTASVLFGMLLVMASVNLLSQNITSTSFGSVFELCSDCCMAAVVLGTAGTLVENASSYLDRLCSIMNAVLPVTEAVYLTEGSVTQLAVHRAAMLLYITVAGNFNNLVLKPLFGALFGFAAVSSVFQQFGLNGFIGGLRKLILTLLSLFTMVFSFILGLQTVLAKSADSLGMKAVRLALGSFIPIIGGTLSEALTTVREGIGVIRSVAGIGGILIILFLALPMTASLFCSNLIFSFCHMAAEILGCSRSAKMIQEIQSTLSILSAVVYATSLLFVMAMILFAKVGGGG